MPFIQSFIVEGKYLGQCERKITAQDLGRMGFWGEAFFCGKCGRLWASCPIVETGTGTTFRFVVRTSTCKKCDSGAGTWSGPGGSLWLGWEKEFIHAWPRNILERELELHLAWAERFFAKT